MDKAKLIYDGNAIIDGAGGWLIGDRQDEGSLRRRQCVLIKYGIHHAGQECKEPWRAQPDKVTVSILIEGGPFIHWFHVDSDEKLPVSDRAIEDKRVLEKVGDYLIYEPAALHTWKAVKESVVITFQFPTEDLFKQLSPTCS